MQKVISSCFSEQGICFETTTLSALWNVSLGMLLFVPQWKGFYLWLLSLGYASSLRLFLSKCFFQDDYWLSTIHLVLIYIGWTFCVFSLYYRWTLRLFLRYGLSLFSLCY